MLTCALVVLALAALSCGLPTEDEVEEVVGFGSPSFKSYSGYLNATSNGRKQHHFYWLTMSQSATADTDPIILWLNGGPGCSSLGGLLEELGPFHPRKDGKSLYENVYAWNKVGHVLFMESPAGVGYSYSEDGKIDTDDNRTADANYAALMDFFEKFPNMTERDFYITGESYGGVYIPTLVARVVDGMNSKEFKGRLKGFAIGNGILSAKHQQNSVMYLQYYRGAIGYETWDDLQKQCCSVNEYPCDFIKYVKVTPSNDWISDGTQCGDWVGNISTTMVSYSQIDQYNQYQDCYAANGAKSQMHSAMLSAVLGKTVDDYLNYDSTDPFGGFPCWQDNATTLYLNMPEVTKSLHVSEHSLAWAPCNDVFGTGNYTRQYFDMSDTMAYIYQHSDVRALIYNGDVDSVCNFLGDEWFVKDLVTKYGLPTIEHRKAWHFRGQIAGFVQRYPRVDLLTVKGSGHFVPTDRPGPALQMIANFIMNTTNYTRPFEFAPGATTTTTPSTDHTTPSTDHTTPSTDHTTKGVATLTAGLVMVFVVMLGFSL